MTFNICPWCREHYGLPGVVATHDAVECRAIVKAKLDAAVLQNERMKNYLERILYWQHRVQQPGGEYDIYTLAREGLGLNEEQQTEKRNRPMTLECPTCGEIADITCKCFMRESKCKFGHEWHSCYVHGGIVLGRRGLEHDDQSCSCS
jgi:hypothetical protein